MQLDRSVSGGQDESGNTSFLERTTIFFLVRLVYLEILEHLDWLEILEYPGLSLKPIASCYCCLFRIENV